MRRDEVADVSPVDGPAAAVAPFAADRIDAIEAAPVHARYGAGRDQRAIARERFGRCFQVGGVRRPAANEIEMGVPELGECKLTPDHDVLDERLEQILMALEEPAEYFRVIRAAEELLPSGTHRGAHSRDGRIDDREATVARLLKLPNPRIRQLDGIRDGLARTRCAGASSDPHWRDAAWIHED